MLTKKILLTAITVASLPLVSQIVHAEEFVITSNGSGSDSDINITSSNTTTVQQNNTANITNTVDVDADTGNNTANANTSDNVSIDTGNAQATTSIQNNVNTSYADVENCNCEDSGSVIVSNNGSFSDNSVQYSSNNTNTVTVNQNANITNHVDGYLNTGGNSASKNTNSDVSIHTGDIYVEDTIKNNVNKSKVKLSTNLLGGYLIDIFGNGADSDNTITVNEDFDNILSVNNVADIYNSSFWNLITGDNTADRNTDGDVDIKTGDVKVVTKIENDVNKSEVVVECGCEEEKPEEEKPPKEEEEKPAGAPVGSSNPPTKAAEKPSEQKKGEVLSAAIGDILPATGTPWFILAILGNLVMLLLGTVLRLRSGRSPGLAYAI